MIFYINNNSEKLKININVNRVKVFVTILVENVEDVRNVICEAGARIIKNLAKIKKVTITKNIKKGMNRKLRKLMMIS